MVRRHLQQAGAPRQITPPQLLPGAAAFGAGSFASQLRRPPQLTAALATAAAERLVQESLDRGTMDNVTAVVGLLQVGGRRGMRSMGQGSFHEGVNGWREGMVERRHAVLTRCCPPFPPHCAVGLRLPAAPWPGAGQHAAACNAQRVFQPNEATNAYT